MADLKVNTEVIVTTAGTISNINKTINADFEIMSGAIKVLDQYWESPAATAAIQKYNDIYTAYFDARYNSVDNFVNFLLQQVGEGYTQTETENISLADAFK